MKKVKLLLAASLLSASQFAGAFGTPAEVAAYDAALLSLTTAQQSGQAITQAMVDSVVNAAANAGISLVTLTQSLSVAGVTPTMITSAVVSNVGTGGGCAPNCGGATIGRVSYAAGSVNTVTTTLATLSSAPTGAGGQAPGGQAAGGQAPAGTPALGGAPTGFGTSAGFGGGSTTTLSFTPTTCSGVSKC